MSSPSTAVARSPCPSPSPPSAIPLPSHLRDTPSPRPGSQSPSFHFPGPSSRYHQRERTRPTHYRHVSNYTPTGPVLSTEKRAHERAQSYHAGKSIFGLPSPTPPTSDCGRSPLSRFPSLSGASFEETKMPSNGDVTAAPVTPAKAKMHRRGSSIYQDSPFSDYFTDDARSMESQTTPTSETQRLLVRLNKLQSQLMRGDSAPELLNIVDRRLGDIESETEGLYSYTRHPAETEDDMFTEEERDNVFASRPVSKRQRQRSNPLGIEGVVEEEEEEEQEEAMSWEEERQDKLLHEAHTALQFLKQAQEQLRQRHQELVNLNEEHSLDMEEKEMEVERLRSENESLKSDLGFDHSELLFLELQLKSLEVDCEDSMYHPKLERLQRQMENWRDDWREVEARFKQRRSRYGVVLHDDKADRDENDRSGEQQDWSVEVKKKGTARVNKLTIRRVSREAESEEELKPSKQQTLDVESTPRPQSKQHNERPSTPSTTVYTSQATQTTPPPSPTLTPIPLSEKLGLTGGSFSSPGADSCAITTSPSSHADEDEDDEDESLEQQSKSAARKEQKRTALRELWSGLTDWAGLGDDDDE